MASDFRDGLIDTKAIKIKLIYKKSPFPEKPKRGIEKLKF